MEEKIIITPNASKMTESLRDTGYNFNVAIADIVDNSISAEASKVMININLNPSTYEPRVYIADNGIGMNFEELKNAMKYGSDSSNNESHLNKFGFGLKTGSTAFCKRLSVLSKGSEGEYHKVTWDLDHISRVNDWELLISDLKDDEIELLETITDGKTGTLVIWEKVDRLLNGSDNKEVIRKTSKRIVDDLQFHLSMVFQRFLDPAFKKKNLEIIVNDKNLKPWDPFCLGEPATEVVIEKNQEVKLTNGETKTFKIKAVVLPRPEDWSIPDGKKKAKVSIPFEGFYVYREDRLIHMGDWLDMFVSEAHVSLSRIEFSFDHELDDLFNVDIKKSRILLNEDIYDYLKRLVTSARTRAIDVYNSAQARKAQSNSSKKGVHSISNKTVESKKDDVISSAVEIINKETGSVKISNMNGETTGTLKILDIPEATERRIVVREKEDDSFLWECGLVNGEHAVILNSKHPFYYKVYAKQENNVVSTALDLLFWSLAEAELATYAAEVKEHYKDMRYQVSSKLKKLVEDLPEPDINK